MKRADAAVLLIRNPFDAILAEFNRNHGGGHTGHASREDFFDREVWYEKALDQAQRWRRLYVSESFDFSPDNFIFVQFFVFSNFII